MPYDPPDPPTPCKNPECTEVDNFVFQVDHFVCVGCGYRN